LRTITHTRTHTNGTIDKHLVAQLVGKKKKDKSETKTGQTKNVRNKNEKTISRQKKRWRALIAPKLVRAANLPISKSP
jgi:hypothetical protein